MRQYLAYLLFNYDLQIIAMGEMNNPLMWKDKIFKNSSPLSRVDLTAGAHLGRGVDPDGSIEKDVVAQLLQQWCPMCQAIQILSKGEELL